MSVDLGSPLLYRKASFLNKVEERMNLFPNLFYYRDGPHEFRKLVLLSLLFAVLLNCRATLCGAAEDPVGRLINPQGSVGVLSAGKSSWEPGVNGCQLFAGDSIKTGPDSRVSILCVDETQLKLNENTVVVLKSSVPSQRLGVVVPAAQKYPGASLYQVQAGEAWLRNKNDKARFEVHTPAVTAAIRGTELNIRVDRNGSTSVVLLEGRLTLANPQGQLDLDPGEEGFAEVGKTPVKRIILQPKDAVQWSLYYPGIFSYRDIPLGGEAASQMLVSAQAAYDRGDLESSERDVYRVLAEDPENAQAILILGWIYLQRQDSQKALGCFEKALKQNASPGLTVCGLALARYRTGDIVGAYRLMKAELKQSSPSLVVVMSGYFSMLVGKIDEAKALLTDSRIRGRDEAIAHSLLSQIYLAQNSKEQAAAEAEKALLANGESPMARMSSALVKISYFDLSAARKLLERSLETDPRFLEAYVYLARLWLGADYLDRAWDIICRAMEISKTDSEVLSLAGFIRLGYRDYDKAFKLFTEAAKNNPGFGEPHIGLANIAFRNRNFGLGLNEMLTATLLEPRVSLYQSSLGKALYQTHSFDKALEVYDYAKTLDPNDPTPYLYKGIALSDLYRPGEAIQEINKSIELNDNMAIFKSRLMLDRDLAVRNTNLARSYNQLGLSDWACSKALTAVKNNPLNGSARLFLYSSYASTRQRYGAADSELLLYWLLSPANENTFSVGTSNSADYTQMFEMPYTRVDAVTNVGTWADHTAPVQDHSIEAYGGLPGLALDAFGEYHSDPGFRTRNNDYQYLDGEFLGKFEPTIKDSFYARYANWKAWEGDTSNINDFSYINDPNQRWTERGYMAEGGYVRRFSPDAVFIGYFDLGHANILGTDWSKIVNYPNPYRLYEYFRYIQDYDNVQLQQQLRIGDHNLMAGFDYFNDTLYNYLFTWQRAGSPPSSSEQFTPSESDTTLYLRDYWHIGSQLLVELGLSGDSVGSYRFGYSRSIYSTTINPAVGLDYEINKSNTLRCAYQSYINHFSLSSTIAPSEVAGFPSEIDVDDGSKVKELGFSWESQWNPKTFTLLNLTGYRVDDPQFWPNHPGFVYDVTERLQGSFTVNRVLTSSLGLSAGIMGKGVSIDDKSITIAGDYRELSGNVKLSYQHPSGWFASIKDTVVQQSLGGSLCGYTQAQSELGNPFNLVDISIGEYFDNKRGFAALSVLNVLNQHFYYQVEPSYLNAPMSNVLEDFRPDREIVFSAGIFF
jgi:tetratricopeptide (TPR) repeat protein